MLSFTKIKILSIYLILILTIFFASLNLKSNNLIDKKVNLGLDLQGGSYILLEIDTKPIVNQKLQTKVIPIKKLLNNNRIKSVLLTGGGTFNKFLMRRIADHTHCKIVIPKPDIINYKEAIIFGFLGLLRWEGKINCLRSVTGARRDNIGGAVYLP